MDSADGRSQGGTAVVSSRLDDGLRPRTQLGLVSERVTEILDSLLHRVYECVCVCEGIHVDESIRLLAATLLATTTSDLLRKRISTFQSFKFGLKVIFLSGTKNRGAADVNYS